MFEAEGGQGGFGDENFFFLMGGTERRTIIKRNGRRPELGQGESVGKIRKKAGEKKARAEGNSFR